MKRPRSYQKTFPKASPKDEPKGPKITQHNLSLQTLDLWVPKINKNNDF